MNPWRAALLGGLTYSLAFWVWLAFLLQPGYPPPDLGIAHPALLVCQALALALLLPAVAPDPKLPATLLAPVLLVAVPWPLAALLALAPGSETGIETGIDAAVLMAGQLGLVAWALVLSVLWRLPARILARPAMVRALLQATALLAPLAGLPLLAGMGRS